MKIGITNSDLPIPELPRHNGTAGTPSSNQPVSPAAETDTVQLSGAHKVPPAAESDVRADKVAEVKAAIESNTFMIDFTKVADQMITEAATLIETMSGMKEPSQQAANDGQNNSQEKFGAGPANIRTPGPDR